jgi:hypothetical protein
LAHSLSLLLKSSNTVVRGRSDDLSIHTAALHISRYSINFSGRIYVEMMNQSRIEQYRAFTTKKGNEMIRGGRMSGDTASEGDGAWRDKNPQDYPASSAGNEFSQGSNHTTQKKMATTTTHPEWSQLTMRIGHGLDSGLVKRALGELEFVPPKPLFAAQELKDRRLAYEGLEQRPIIREVVRAWLGVSWNPSKTIGSHPSE